MTHLKRQKLRCWHRIITNTTLCSAWHFGIRIICEVVTSYLCFFYPKNVFFCRFRCVISTLTNVTNFYWSFFTLIASECVVIRHAIVMCGPESTASCACAWRTQRCHVICFRPTTTSTTAVRVVRGRLAGWRSSRSSSAERRPLATWYA